MPSVVPGNALQERFRKSQQYKKRPDIASRNEVDVIVIKVYDAETLASEEIPDDLVRHLIYEPGVMYAKVRTVRTQRELIVGFKSAEAPQSNSVLLQGLRGTIVYNGLRPEDGRLTITGRPQKALVRLARASKTYDISGII